MLFYLYFSTYAPFDFLNLVFDVIDFLVKYLLS